MPILPDEILKSPKISEKAEVQKTLLILARKGCTNNFVRQMADYIRIHLAHHLYSRERNIRGELYYDTLKKQLLKSDNMRLFEQDTLDVCDTYGVLCFLLMTKNYFVFRAKIVNDYGMITMKDYQTIK